MIRHSDYQIMTDPNVKQNSSIDEAAIKQSKNLIEEDDEFEDFACVGIFSFFISLTFNQRYKTVGSRSTRTWMGRCVG